MSLIELAIQYMLPLFGVMVLPFSLIKLMSTAINYNLFYKYIVICIAYFSYHIEHSAYDNICQ